MLLQQAIEARPDLRDALEHVGPPLVQEATTRALAGNYAGQDIPTVAQILERAQIHTEREREKRLIAESRRFFEPPDRIHGASLSASGQSIGQLADGDVIFGDLPSLLRYAPEAGPMAVRSGGSSHLGATGLGLIPVRQEATHIQVGYGTGLVKRLYYWKYEGRRVPMAVTVTAAGYSVEGGPVQPFAERMPAAVRRDNLARLDALVERAKVRRTATPLRPS